MTRPVLILTDEAMIRHDTGPGHPERPDRLRAILASLRGDPIEHTTIRAPEPIERRHLLRVHDERYVDQILALRGKAARLDADTVAGEESVGCAELSAGAAVETARAVIAGESARAFALGRPPGHHAEFARAMGFCLFNNIAVAASWAIEEAGIERVLIVDFDVHHGNGTQHAFEARRDVLFVSLHQSPLWPGSGRFDEIGVGDGAGFTVNVPLAPGLGDADYAAVFDQVVAPVAERFEPGLVLVSAGFDAHRRDPLGSMELTDEGYRAMTARLGAIADAHAGGRLVMILEGGYDLEGLVGGVRACAEEMTRGPHVFESVQGTSAEADVAIEFSRKVLGPLWGL